MSYRGTLPSGQAFPGQGDQMHGHQNGYSFQPQSPMAQNQNQNQQQQHQLHQQSLQPALHHNQQAMYPGGINHEQQFYHANQQGFYMHPQQFQQQQQQHQPQPIMPYNNANFNLYQNFDAGGHGRAHQMQTAANQYLPPSNLWPQPMTQQLQQPLQQQSVQQHQPLQQQQPPHTDPYHAYPAATVAATTTSAATFTATVDPAASPKAPPSPAVQQQQKQRQYQTPQRPQAQKTPSSQPPQSQPHIPTAEPQELIQPIQPPLPEEEQQQFHYVNLQDIQKQPLLPPLPLIAGNKTNTEDAEGEPMDDTVVFKQPRSNSAAIKQEEDSTTVRIPQQIPDARIKRSPHSSVTNSPALSTRSPSITRRSPAVPPKSRPVNTTPLMVAIAEECLDKARAGSHDVAMTLCPDQIDEYQKLIATSLSCLEAVLQSNQLPPREEARVRLRYASILKEETENLMEAETALGKGITLCDKHRLYDLKYCMQYLMLKVLFQRNHKAALKAIDGHISNCEAFKHVQWYYAFRLLKASFYLDIASTADAGALDNLRSIQNVANSRGDNALSVLASLLEGFTLLKTTKDNSMEKIQTCIAQAAKFQFDPAVQQIIQLPMLTLLLEVTASMHHQSPDHTAQKLRLLQKALDECEDWHNVKADFLVPVKKQPSTAKTVSDDTRAIIRLGDGECETDFVIMSFMTKMELKSLVFTISGLANFHKPSSQGRRSTEFWLEGLKILDTWDKSTTGIPYGPPVPLNVAMKQRAWRIETQAYLNILLGLVAASHCQWANVKQVVLKLKTLVSPSTQAMVRLLTTYLTGVYHQGIGDLQTALNIFKDDCFAVPIPGAGTKVGQQEVALLAGLNRLWIMQHPSCRSDHDTMDLIEQLQPQCTNHWNVDLRTAWHNVMAALVTEPAQQLNQQKQHIHAAMAGSKSTSNVLGAAVTLCIMRSRFFENVIGEQALKSARAAAKQAQRSGNVLWQSVADGMLAHSYEVQGQREEAKQEWDKATMEARDAFSRSL
ncbi:hypothetical protein PT974_06808 [Cladobotryum mycophilum]|uniref:75k gamma secalin n=1 Tax=Cladobotryum mycophilum TaxID=491253 RepID=A0ABR0SMP8_9HYPO